MSNEDKDINLSFEFFPPKTEQGQEKLKAVRTQLNKLNPDFFSVTYGAGGSTRDNTKGVIKAMREEGLPAAPHLSFGGDHEETMYEMVDGYKSIGVDRIVALRGDMPSGMGAAMQMVYANELVAFIREKFGNHFHLSVAAYPEIHPEARSYREDVRYLKGKFDAGANSAITQYFYNPDAYFYFLEECGKEGIDAPIIPGIMPITNYQNLARFSDACGAEIPRWIRKRLDDFSGNNESLTSFATDLVTELCETLLENGAPGLHFYTMNQIEPTRSIVLNLGLSE
ncbi:methylenetetrahydrofolate reductase [NAD(P)H] [Teredinibacter haidensis]|uniref:methylenetetrahydrofolate reductase [NAD(P)H] n=1 Tax=Teredinibacter haidensis TaxID=2731755 RepID=UPI000948BC56|nr:methylenetetrahydrofolate reductase [NAD(P)H] [Teredinibacter haidensis]